MSIKTHMKAGLVALALVAAAPLPGMASVSITQDVQAQITDMLTADGYEVRKIVPEDGMIEVYAIKDGQMLELYLDADLNIIRIKQK